MPWGDNSERTGPAEDARRAEQAGREEEARRAASAERRDEAEKERGERGKSSNTGWGR